MATYAEMNVAGICVGIASTGNPAFAAQMGWVGPIDSLNPMPTVGWTFDGTNWWPPIVEPPVVDQNLGTLMLLAEQALATNAAFVPVALDAEADNEAWITEAGGATYPLSTAEQTALVNQVVTLTQQIDGLANQVLTLTQQCSALIRIAFGMLDTTSGT